MQMQIRRRQSRTEIFARARTRAEKTSASGRSLNDSPSTAVGANATQTALSKSKPKERLRNIMDDLTIRARGPGSPQSPVLVIIEHLVLTRTCIVSILKREFNEFEIVEMATPTDLDGVAGQDVRLVALDIGNKPIIDPFIDAALAHVAGAIPDAYVALLSTRDDEATAMAAMERGVRGFFPTSIPIEVAVAGLRLVLAGGIYRPLPLMTQSDTPYLDYAGGSDPSASHGINGVKKGATEITMADFTPREQHVLAELEQGLPNKLIAAKLTLSENTVKMHVQHIMRKFSARNRTEAVMRWRTIVGS
jgi:DNA-binding NarL/FixJ family response regulator